MAQINAEERRILNKEQGMKNDEVEKMFNAQRPMFNKKEGNYKRKTHSTNEVRMYYKGVDSWLEAYSLKPFTSHV